MSRWVFPLTMALLALWAADPALAALSRRWRILLTTCLGIAMFVLAALARG